MPTDSRRLNFLLAVHRYGGILAAANRLGITPSAVSQQISRLEAEEGYAVLDRGPRGVSLTPAGVLLAEAAERIEAELVEVRRAVEALGDGVSGTVGVGVFQTAVRAFVAPAIGVLADRYPALQLDVDEAEPAESIRKLRVGDLDVAILERDADVANPTQKGTADVVLADEPWRLVTPAMMEPPTTLADLARLTFVASEEGTAAYRALQRLSQTLGAPIATRHSTYDFDTTITLVESGQGVALLPALALTDIDDNDQLRVVRLAGMGTRQIFVRHRVSRHEPTAAVRAVIDAFSEIAGRLVVD